METYQNVTVHSVKQADGSEIIYYGGQITRADGTHELTDVHDPDFIDIDPGQDVMVTYQNVTFHPQPFANLRQYWPPGSGLFHSRTTSRSSEAHKAAEKAISINRTTFGVPERHLRSGTPLIHRFQAATTAPDRAITPENAGGRLRTGRLAP